MNSLFHKPSKEGKLHILNYIVTVLMTICVVALPAITISTIFSPEEINFLSLSWFAFPYLWLLSVLFIFVAVFIRRPLMAFAYTVIVILTYPNVSLVLNLHSSPAEEDEVPILEEGKEPRRIKFLTYNVLGMSNKAEMERDALFDSLYVFFTRENPDILCIQECPGEKEMEKLSQNLQDLLNSYDYKYYEKVPKGSIQCTFSRFPLEGVPGNVVIGVNDTMPAITVTDVRLPGDERLRIYNCHLASLHISSDLIKSMSQDKKASKTWLRSFLDAMHRILKADKVRAAEIRQLCRAIENTQSAVVVCGDFNDIPTSYAYIRVSHSTPMGDDGVSLKDAFRPRYLGFERTYRGNLPPLRIDYIFTSRSLSSRAYKEHNLPCSDHKALTAEIYY